MGGLKQSKKPEVDGMSEGGRRRRRRRMMGRERGTERGQLTGPVSLRAEAVKWLDLTHILRRSL